jgi:acyl-CoA thioester hydrolase
MNSKTHITPLRVRFGETDQMGVVYHTHYLNWFEIGRTEMLRSKGRTYREIEEEGLRLPVLKAACQFHKPALYDDEIEIHTLLETYTGVKMNFSYEIFRGEEWLASGHTSHCWTNADFKPVHLRKVAPELHQLFENITKGA